MRMGAAEAERLAAEIEDVVLRSFLGGRLHTSVDFRREIAGALVAGWAAVAEMDRVAAEAGDLERRASELADEAQRLASQ